MKIERINENQIRCTLNGSDLAERQIEISELAYGSSKARRLFQELIQTAAAEVGFEIENMPIMVEAVPLSMDSIMLIVTRVEDPDELDTRFSRFSPNTEEGWEDTEDLTELTSGLLEGAAALKDTLAKLASDGTSSQASSTAQPSFDVASFHLFAFESLDAAAAAAAALRGMILVHSTLYKNPSDGQYYLCIHLADDEDAFRRICNTLSEYGTPQRNRPAILAYCEEHCETIIAARALDKLAKLA